MNDRVSVTIEDGVADVRLVRVDKMNALDDAMFEAIIEAGVRLKTERGLRAVVPGDTENSDLLARVTSADPDLRMPPPSEGDPLTAQQVEDIVAYLETLQ